MRSICVYCGSSPGNLPAYLAAAEALGAALAARAIGLVYGGGSVGIMGALADTVLAAGGRVTGVIPRAMMERGVAHDGLSELQVVETMHARKAAMAALADGFIALPGGLGTIEEIFEAITWAQLGYHRKPCGFLNVSGYFDHLAAFLDHATGQGFIGPAHRAMILFEEDPLALLERFAAYQPPDADKLASALEHTARARSRASGKDQPNS